MIEAVYNILKILGRPCKWNVIPKFKNSNTVISYHFFNETTVLFGDGAALEDGGKLQVDIYSKVDYTSTVKEVKKLLVDAGFLFEDSTDDTENLDENTMLYHKVMVFNYSEGEVVMNGKNN